MNHVYRIVWSAASKTFIAVAENAKGRGKRATGKAARSAKALALAATALASPWALAGPAGGQVVAGQGSIAQSGSSTTINQATNKLAINWQSFNIGANESVTFNQPGRDAIALNRVLGSSGTEIHGSLNANGQVFVVNPNGVLFGKGSSVSAGGLVASTQGVSDADFMAGNFRFSGDSKAKVVNQGSIRAHEGGYAALIGSSVSNQGLISAKLGSVALAAGSETTLEIDNGSLTKIQVSKGALRALAENKQLIEADGGRVILTAKALDALSSSVVNNEGVIQARSMQAQGGVVRLSGEGESSLAANTGSIDSGSASVSARGVLQAGSIKASERAELLAANSLVQTQAGAIEAGSIRLQAQSSATVSGSAKAGSDLTVAADAIALAAADLSAGSSLRVGGGAHGAEADVKNASSVRVNAASKLSVGDNGSLVVWSEKSTQFYGQAVSGDRSFAEVSSKGTLTFGGSVKTGADSQVLFDPTSIVISDSAQGQYAIDLPNASQATNDNHGSGGGVFLANGNIVISSPNDNFGGPAAGAVYLYNGANGALISALFGSSNEDRVGSSVTRLSNGNFVSHAPSWNLSAGAVTWINGSSGLSGVVSDANSLVGTEYGSSVGQRVTPLANGHYVVGSNMWLDDSLNRVGAATWGNGLGGTTGYVSAANSLIGAQHNDGIGGGVTALPDGNYVVASTGWSNGSNVSAGSATWGDGAAGTTGVVSAANSVVGSSAHDQVGLYVIPLLNGAYAVGSPHWSNGAMEQAGAVTWVNGASGVKGAVSAANSIVGSTAYDSVGQVITPLSNGNFIVSVQGWDNGSIVNAGAASWVSGSVGRVVGRQLAGGLRRA